MDTKKLAVFVDLAKTQNYSRSAERLFLSQSTISKYIIMLEKEWQVKLFIRAHRQVKLTREGKLILPKVEEILRKEDEFNYFLINQVWQKERPLIIKGLPSLSQYEAFNIITEFTEQYPEVNLKFSEENVDKLNYALDEKNVDIVFTRAFDTSFPSYDVITGEADQLVVLVPKNNPLAKQTALTLDMLKNESLLVLSDTMSKTNPLYEAFKNKSLQPHITYDGQRIDLILAMINQGSGISVVMNKSFDLTKFKNIAVVPLKPRITSHLVLMKQHDNTTAVVELFWKFALKKSQNWARTRSLKH